jgi:hypothetical protein
MCLLYGTTQSKEANRQDIGKYNNAKFLNTSFLLLSIIPEQRSPLDRIPDSKLSIALCIPAIKATKKVC